MASSKLDTSHWLAGLDMLAGPIRVSLARSMAVAGGKVLRDEAKARIHTVNGVLANAIYLAFRDAYSDDRKVQYAVTWNKRKAPHGHLVEFGHWQIHPVIKLPSGTYITDKKRRLKTPRWVPAYPFLRPAMDAAGGRARAAMIARGRERLPQLLAGAQGVDDEL